MVKPSTSTPWPTNKNKCVSLHDSGWCQLCRPQHVIYEGQGEQQTVLLSLGRCGESPPADATNAFEQVLYVCQKTSGDDIESYSYFRWNQMDFIMWTCTHWVRQGSHEAQLSEGHGIWRIRKRKDSLPIGQPKIKRSRNIWPWIQN